MTLIILAISFLFFAAAVAVVIYNHLKNRRLLNSLEKMLKEAMEGNFTGSHYDESLLSKLESELADFLSSSSLSAQNVKAEKDKLKELISDISHQTKTPIANLVLYAELLQDSSEKLTEEEKANVNAIQVQAEKLRFLIDSLVKLSRLESGIISLEKNQTELRPLLENITGSLKDRAQAKGLKLKLNPTDAYANIDSKWTQEAIFNIVDNAVKYTQNGSIEIRASQFDMFVKIDVTDTGPGIPEEEQTKIFGRFYRASTAKADTQEGLGIGLHLSREIISGQGGYIKVSSPIKDFNSRQHTPGTRFSIYLPK